MLFLRHEKSLTWASAAGNTVGQHKALQRIWAVRLSVDDVKHLFVEGLSLSQSGIIISNNWRIYLPKFWQLLKKIIYKNCLKWPYDKKLVKDVKTEFFFRHKAYHFLVWWNKFLLTCAKPLAQLLPAPPPSLAKYTFSGLYSFWYSLNTCLVVMVWLLVWFGISVAEPL